MTDTTDSDATIETEPPEASGEPVAPDDGQLEATGEPLGAPDMPRRPSARASFGLAFILGLAAALLLGVGALYAYDRQFTGRILPGVHVGSVDLSGLNADEARAALQEAYGSLSDGRLVLTGAAGEHVISYADIGRRADLDAMLDEAIAVGRDGSPLDRAVADARTVVRGVFLEPKVTFDADALNARITAVADSLRVEPRDAIVETASDGQFRVVDSQAGTSADPAPAVAAFLTALGEVDAPPELRADLRVGTVEPAVTTAEATMARQQADRITADIVLVVGEDRLRIGSAELRRWITFATTTDGTYSPTLDTTLLTKVIQRFAPQVDRDPVDASFTITDGKVPVISPSKDGYKLDVAATVAQVQSMLAGRAAGLEASEVVPTLTVTPPALTTAQAEAAAPQMTLISSWKTYFPISDRNGFGANIWIPALTIDGTIVAPHATFDFWQAIGPVTREKGYTDGGAIINGKTEPQGALAGGICSCSTTLFNAALRGGFQMNARRNHFYYIDRYPLGLDATVFISASGAVQTMSWTNDTDYPVLIRGYKIRNGTRGYVKFELYSVPNGRKVVISNPIVKNVKPATDTTQLTTTLAPGVRQRVEYPVDGKQVWRTVTVYDASGAILHQTTYYSNYARITGLTLIGAPRTTAPTPSPTPT
ncbi:MAG: VanW family protein, partial [Candidatus Limnocylindrales bacterium]